MKNIAIKSRIDDAFFLWENDRKESAFTLILIAVAGLSKLRYPKSTDSESFKNLLRNFNTVRQSVEFRGKLQTIEHILYKWIRCSLVHEANIPIDIEFQEDLKFGEMSIRAGGSPEYKMKLGTGWFFHLANSVLNAKELINDNEK